MKILSKVFEKKDNSFPYKVDVTQTAEGMHITVFPPPEASKPEYLNVVTGTFTRILTDVEGIPNTARGRKLMKDKVTNTLHDFHEQGMIVPRGQKEKEEGKRPDEHE